MANSLLYPAIALLIAASLSAAYTPTKMPPLNPHSTVVCYKYDMNQLDITAHEGEGDVTPTHDGMVLRTRSKFSASFDLPILVSTNNISPYYRYLLQGEVSITLSVDGNVIQTYRRTLDSPFEESCGFSIPRTLEPGTHRLTLSIEALDKKPVEVTIKEIQFLSGGKNAPGRKQAATQSGKP
jgi:hypothetical protein